MERAPNTTDITDATIDVTQRLADYASGLTLKDVPEDVQTIAKQCLLDWLGVTLAGAQEPLTQKLLDYARAEGCGDHATLLGLDGRGSASQAALINGSAGHALDYDDVLRLLRGHPTAPVAPVALALAERDLKSGEDLLLAFIAGVEVEARIGGLIGDAHYAKGWHQTATVGTFGAAAAGARILGLDGPDTAVALGIAGTQAAGLKAMFGTMCKPLHAGKAAANGLLAAELAKRQFTSRPDVLECAQGFAATQADGTDPSAALDGLGEAFCIPKLLFKYHAACYGTHAGIESARAVAGNPAFALDKIERVEVNVPERTMNMCNILEPTTGLEVKFSHRFTTALALAGEETGSLEVYDDSLATRPDLVALRDKITIHGREDYTPNQTDVTVHQSDGTAIMESRDMAVPNADLGDQWRKLETKFRALADPLIGVENAERTVTIVRDLERQDDASGIAAACRTCR